MSRPYAALRILAIAMALVLTAVLVNAVRSQNQFGYVTHLEGLTILGHGNWAESVEGGVRGVRIGDDFLAIAGEDRIRIFNSGGGLRWSEAFDDLASMAVAGDTVLAGLTTRTGRVLVGLDGDTGDELWRLSNARLVDPGGEVSIVRNNGIKVIDSATGDLVYDLEAEGRTAVAEHDMVVELIGRTLTAVTVDGPRSPVEIDVSSGARIAQVGEGVVVIDQPGDGSGRLVRGFRITDGTELWRRVIRGFRAPSEQPLSGQSGTVLDPATGASTPWIEIEPATGEPGAVARVDELKIPDERVRAFHVGRGTLVIDAGSGQVLWEDPSRKLRNVIDGLGRFSDGDSVEVINARTGQILAEFPKGQSTSFAFGNGKALFAWSGRITLVDRAGNTSIVADIRPDARVLATSARYGAVVDDMTSTNAQLHVYDYTTGEEVFTSEVDPDAIARFRDERLTIRDGPTAFRIRLGDGPRFGDVERVRARFTLDPDDAELREMVIATDRDRTRAQWCHNRPGNTVIGAFDDIVVIVTIEDRRESSFSPEADPDSCRRDA